MLFNETKYGPMKDSYKAARSMKQRITRRAKEIGVPCDIKMSDLYFPTHCPVLGIPLAFRGGDNSPSMDRLNPKEGYIKGNVRIISKRANTIKSNAITDEVKKVYEWMQNQNT